jgi:ABC-type transport system involved in multi-copper enzyme maturation permease subunit
MNLRAIWTVFRFEFNRTLSAPRLMILAVLALFPAALLLLIQFQGGRLEVDAAAGIALFVLVPEMVVVMALLLWAAPLVYAELEGKTWSYLAVSPAGRGAILLGKYLNAACWTAMASWTSLLLSLIVLYKAPELLTLAWVLAVLCLLSSLSYGAIYSLIGVVFLRRAVAAAVAYTLIAEVIIGTIPIVINISQLTVQYHLRSLLVKWLNWDDALRDRLSGIDQAFSTASPSLHVLSLGVFATVVLSIAIYALRRRELVIADRG